MRTWPILAFMTFLGACGGIVVDPTPSPEGTSSPTTTSTVVDPSPTNTSVPPATTSTATPTPTPTPTTRPVPPPVVAGALSIEVMGDTLGAPPGLSNKRTYAIDPSSDDVTVTRGNEDASRTLILTTQERAKLDALLSSVTENPMPTLCSYDGPTASMRVSRSGTRTTYLADDYNCMHRRDVSYAKGIQGPLSFLDEIAKRP